MLKIENNNVLIPVSLWNELKMDLYFNELIEALEDRQELLETRDEPGEFIDFREYDRKRMAEQPN